MEDLPLGTIAAFVPEFAVKDLPLGRTLMMMIRGYIWRSSINNFCAHSPRTCFVAADHLFLVFSVMLKIASTLSRGMCRLICGHCCANWESCQVWGARCYSFSAGWWDLKLSCRRGTLSCGIVLLHNNERPHACRLTQALLHEQFHWDIFEHPSYNPYLLFPKMKEHLAGKCFTNDEDLKDDGWITRQPHGMNRVYTNWCQGISALMSKATVWKNRQR